MTHRPGHQTTNDEITAAMKTEEKNQTLKDDTRQHCLPDSDTFTAFDTAMRWFWMSAKGKEKKKRYNSTPYSPGATWLCNTGNNWFNKHLKIKVSGFTVYIVKILFLNMCSSKRVHSIKTRNLCKCTILPSYFLTLRDFLDKVPLRGPQVLGYWIKTPSLCSEIKKCLQFQLYIWFKDSQL